MHPGVGLSAPTSGRCRLTPHRDARSSVEKHVMLDGSAIRARLE